MRDQKLAKRLMETYVDELHDHAVSLGRDLLALEKNATPEQQRELWTSIFRVAHTLKGASGMVDIAPVRDACHHLEDIFGFHRDQQTPMSEELTSVMLKVVDAIEEVGARLRSDDDLDGTPIFELLPELQRIFGELEASRNLANQQPGDDAADEETDFDFDDDLVTETPVSQDPSAGQTSPTRAQPIESQSNTKEAPDAAAEMRDELIPLFLDELDDHVTTLSRNVLAMENAAEDEKGELLNSLFRAAHSMKGAARSVELDAVETVCHRLEDVLTGLRDGNTQLTTDLVSRILETSDAIADVGKRMRRGDDLKSAPILGIEKKLIASVASSRPETAAQSDTESKTSTPPSPPSPVTEKPRRPLMPVSDQASIRVAAQKLDALLAHSGELLVARGRFALRAKHAANLRDMATNLRSLWAESQRAIQRLDKVADDEPESASELVKQSKTMLAGLAKQLDSLSSGMEADNRMLGQTCDLLDDEVYNVRMLPFSDACGGLERAVRDIATATNKRVAMRIDGADLEVDRSVLEGLKDPLLHLVRNAVDHGIESPQQRIAAGKPPEAVLTISASLRGGQVEVRVEDDGLGFDLPRICSIAQKRGIEVPEDHREQARLVFAPGFSTAKLITDISGRGVGLDVVQSQVESLHGDVDVAFEVGKGTTFTLLVPLTLTTIRCMLVKVNDQVYAVPTTSVDRLVRFGINEVRSSAGRDTLLLREAPTGLVALATTLGLKSKGLISGKSTKGLAVVLAAGDQRVAVVVDDVLAEQEILVKNLGARVRRLRHFSGCTLLPDGRIALVMNAANVVRSALGMATSRSSIALARHDQKWVRKQLLLVDDSVTTRTLLKNILETAGYDVVAAADGQQAWDIAQDRSFDVVVSDVDMPRVDGFELTSMFRSAPKTVELPIVLVTARGTDQDKEQGVKVGANAYIVKGSFEQQSLLDTLAQLV